MSKKVKEEKLVLEPTTLDELGLGKGTVILSRSSSGKLKNFSKMAQGEVFKGEILEIIYNKKSKYPDSPIMHCRDLATNTNIMCSCQTLIQNALQLDDDGNTPFIGKGIAVAYKGTRKAQGKGKKNYHDIDAVVFELPA